MLSSATINTQHYIRYGRVQVSILSILTYEVDLYFHV